ncbi:hypothetical protein ES702_04944 [subsurface metagenome]
MPDYRRTIRSAYNLAEREARQSAVLQKEKIVSLRILKHKKGMLRIGRVKETPEVAPLPRIRVRVRRPPRTEYEYDYKYPEARLVRPVTGYYPTVTAEVKYPRMLGYKKPTVATWPKYPGLYKYPKMKTAYPSAYKVPSVAYPGAYKAPSAIYPVQPYPSPIVSPTPSPYPSIPLVKKVALVRPPKVGLPEYYPALTKKKRKLFLKPQPKVYQPSLVAIEFRIRGKAPKKITGFEIRPLTKAMKLSGRSPKVKI